MTGAHKVNSAMYLAFAIFLMSGSGEGEIYLGYEAVADERNRESSSFVSHDTKRDRFFFNPFPFYSNRCNHISLYPTRPFPSRLKLSACLVVSFFSQCSIPEKHRAELNRRKVCRMAHSGVLQYFRWSCLDTGAKKSVRQYL